MIISTSQCFLLRPLFYFPTVSTPNFLSFVSCLFDDPLSPINVASMYMAMMSSTKTQKNKSEHQQKRTVFFFSVAIICQQAVVGQSQGSMSSFTVLFWQTTCVQITEHLEFMLVTATLDPEDSIPLHLSPPFGF